jgi:hypothetical protein
MQHFFSIYFKKSSFEQKFFGEFSYHSGVEGFSYFHMSTWKYPWSIVFVLDEKYTSLRIE